MSTTDLSVILTNYNHAHYLPQSIAAVLDQSAQPKEFIVLDDGSTDDSLKVLEALAARAPIIRLVRNECNRGVCATIQRGIGLATGRFLLFCAADDYVLPGIIEKSVTFLEQHPEAGISCGYHSTVDGLTGVVSRNPSRWCAQPTYFTPSALARSIDADGIPSSSAVYRRAAVLNAGGYIAALRWSSDWFMNLVIAFRQGLCYIPEPLALIRLMPTSYGRDGMMAAENRRTVVAEILRQLNSPAYNDVLPHFRVSGVLKQFLPELTALADSTHELWRLAALLLEPLGLRHQIQHLQVRKLWRRARSAAGRCKRAMTSPWRRSA